MKKIIAFLTMAFITISASMCVFAASSPSGESKPDEFNVIGNVEFSATVAVIDDDLESKIDKNGNFRIEGIETGTHVLVIKNDSVEVGKVTFSVAKGKETKYVLLEDGSYDITVAANISTIRIDFKIDGGKIVISELAPAGNDSPQSPETGDVATSACVMLLVISFVGIVSSAYFRKKYAL